MTKVMFAACERVLIDNTGLASVLVVLQNINLKTTGEEVPTDVVMPKEWALACMWAYTAEEELQEFVQQIEIFWPDKKSFVCQSIPFRSLKDGMYAFNYTRIEAFPVGQTGMVTLRGWVEKEGKIITEKAEYSVRVLHDAPTVIN